MNKLKNSSILYVEDDEITRENISVYLKRQCKELFLCADGEEGLECFIKNSPDIIITDIEMPKLNGLDMIKKIRKISPKTLIIVASAYDQKEYLAKAVNLQLMQYIIKPLSINKINTALNECEKYLTQKIITKTFFEKNIYYDTFSKELKKDELIINLSKKERELIELFIKKFPAPCSYEIILNVLYYNEGSKNAIKLLVKSLRDKISKSFISNVSGFGYKLKVLN